MSAYTRHLRVLDQAFEAGRKQGYESDMPNPFTVRDTKYEQWAYEAGVQAGLREIDRLRARILGTPPPPPPDPKVIRA